MPGYKPSQYLQEWTPVLERISQETGIKLKLQLPASIVKLEEVIRSGTPDFACLNPYHALLAVKNKGDINNISDQDGKVIGFPSPTAFAQPYTFQPVWPKSNTSN